MDFKNYKFVLTTCASSENEVTGEDIDLEDRFESDLAQMNVRPGVVLFSPKTEIMKFSTGDFETKIFPDFNFKVLEVLGDGLRLERSFAYTNSSNQFEITLDKPQHTDSFWFGRYSYSYILELVRK